MKTVISLVYMHTISTPENALEALHGPYLFESQEAAKDKLYSFIIDEAASFYKEELVDFLEAKGFSVDSYIRNNDQVVTEYYLNHLFNIHRGKLSVEEVVNWFSEIANKGKASFSFKMTDQPTKSFVECVSVADGLLINDDYFGKLTITPIKSTDCNDSTLVETEGTNSDNEVVEYQISATEARYARYCTEQKCWIVNNLQIKIIQYQ